MAEKDDSKDTAKKLQKLYLQNLALKLREGKALTPAEFEHLRLLSQDTGKPDIPAPDIPEKQTQDEEDDDKDAGVPERLRFRRSYTLTERALEARRKNAQKSTGPKTPEGKKASSKNAWKYGQFAQGYILNRVKPCKSTCPQYPCELVKDNSTQPGGECLDKAAVIQFFSAICEAVKNKQYDDFNEVTSLTIANQIHILHTLMEDIQRDGTMLKKEKHDKDGKYLGYEVVPHPSMLSLIKLSDSLGLTANELMITPKALSKQADDDEGIKTLADLMSRIGGGMKNKSEE